MRNRAKRSQSSRAAESYCKSVDVKALLVAYTRRLSNDPTAAAEAFSDRPKSWSPPRSIQAIHFIPFRYFLPRDIFSTFLALKLVANFALT